MTTYIDINCDMGESYGRWTLGHDEEVMPHITSANVACGFHGGDPHVMRKSVELAVAHGVAIGAHPGLPDLMGFGRRRMEVSTAELKDYHRYQVGALSAFAQAAGTRLQHVKAHGIQYFMFEENLELGRASAEQVIELDPELILPYLLARRGRSQDLILELTVEAIRAGQQLGEIRSGNAVAIGRGLLLAAHGNVLSTHTMVDDQVSEAELDDEFALLLRQGLRP
jgi:lactam utilization protein B